MRRFLAPLLPLAAAASACLQDCNLDLPPQSLVDRLRVLAVKAEPAEIPWPLDGDPERVQFTAFIADPQGGGREVSATFMACKPLTEPPEFRRVNDLPPLIAPATSDCPLDGEPALPSRSPGSAIFDPLAAIARFGRPSPFDGGPPPGLTIPDGGVSLLEGLAAYRVGFEVAAGGERVRGFRSILPSPLPPNRNPEIALVDFDGQVLREDEVPTVAPNRTHIVRIVATEESLERYLGLDGEQHQEKLTAAYHATAGTIAQRTAVSTDGGVVGSDAVNWNPPQDNPLTGFTVPKEGMEITFFLVVRDDRGGTGWTTRKVRVVPEGSPGP